MPDIVLTTLNAKYIHAAFGLRYLLANLGELRERACILEFDINQRANDIVEAILARNPRIVGIGVYIWNATLSREVASTMKRVRPDILIVLGGPEVSFETEQQLITHISDYVITGEADLKFAEVCRKLLAGEKPEQRIIPAEVPELSRIEFPYALYDANDLAHRIVYVEASRGCPFTCEFCLSSLDIPVRQFALEPFLAQMQLLYDRGLNHFKFVDRTFNLNLATSRSILNFFLERYREGLFLHFEMIPDRLPEALRELIAKFPPGVLQFEVGIQTFDETVSARIKRRQNYQKLADNVEYLRGNTGVHIHADLIVGLPGETMESFAAGFDRLIALKPQEIQVGILKRLRGTPIARHDSEWGMAYQEQPPYEILQNKNFTYGEIQRMRRFSRYWDMIGNSGNFLETMPLICNATESAFYSFIALSDWLHATSMRTHGIARVQLFEFLFRFLTEVRSLDSQVAAENLWRDYQRGGHLDKPQFLRPYINEEAFPARGKRSTLKRQARHLAA
jgi:radical SAM superfamily enzyme YgiQ (UPF0313 family)